MYLVPPSFPPPSVPGGPVDPPVTREVPRPLPHKMDQRLQGTYIVTEIYDIGTEILYFQCFVTTDMFLFCKPIFFSGNCRICRDLAFGSVKTRFKAILKKLDFSAQIDFSARLYLFMNF